MYGEFLFAFVAGAIATANPCGFALLPAYLARRLGNVDRDIDRGTNGIIHAIGIGAVTTAGFMLIFGLAGSAVSLGAYWLTDSLPWAGFAIGIVLVAIGIATIMRWHKFSGWRGDLLFGVGYGTVSISCTLPIFMMVTGTSMTGGLVASAFSFFAYALGMGAVFMALAIATVFARDGLAKGIKGLSPYLGRISGLLLFLSGLYVSYYWGRVLFIPDVQAFSNIVETGLVWSGFLQTWLGNPDGETFLLGLFFILVALFSWAMLRRFLAGKTDQSEAE